MGRGTGVTPDAIDTYASVKNLPLGARCPAGPLTSTFCSFTLRRVSLTG